MAVQVKFDRSKTYAQAVAAKTTAAGTIFFTTDTNDIVIAGDTYGGGGITPLYTEGGLKIGSTILLGAETDIRVPVMTSSTLGVAMLFSDTVQSVAANAVSSTTGRTYGLQLNSSKQLVVNVPWTDTVYTHPTYTAQTAGLYKIGRDATGHVVIGDSFSIPTVNNGKLSIKGGTTEIASFTANQSGNVDFSIVAGANISVTPDATNHKVTIANTYSYSLPSATSSILGGVKLFSDTVQSVAANAVSSTTGRTYGVQLNSNKQLVVNVPWTDSPVIWEGE
jgi:hypothetical protein